MRESNHNLADEMIESETPDREEAVMTFRRNIGGGGSYIQLKEIFQCPACGRMLIENTLGSFCSFLPEGENIKNLLDFKANGNVKLFIIHNGRSSP